MSNETILLVAAAVIITAIVVGTVTSYANKKTAVPNKTSLILACIGEIVTEVYEEYKALGGINETKYSTDEEYRMQVINEIVGVIQKVCAKNNIELSSTDTSVLSGIASIVVEKIFDEAKMKAKTAEVEKLDKKIKDMSSPDTANNTEKTVSISLGDFYKE